MGAVLWVAVHWRPFCDTQGCQPFLRKASRPPLHVWACASPLGITWGFPLKFSLGLGLCIPLPGITWGFPPKFSLGLGLYIPRGHHLGVSPLIQPRSILRGLSLGSFPGFCCFSSQHTPRAPLQGTSPLAELQRIAVPGSGLPSPSGQATMAN